MPFIKNYGPVVCVFALLVLASSCGVISKTRYGNGLKLNVEFNAFKKDNARPAKARERSRSVQSEEKRNHGAVDSIGHVQLHLQQTERNMVPAEAAKNNSLVFQQIPYVQTKTTIASSGSPYKVKAENNKIGKEAKESRSHAARPVETYVLLGALLFYGAIVLTCAAIIMEIEVGAGIAGILALCVLAGFILSIVGLIRIKRGGHVKSGRKMAKSIIGLFVSTAIAVTLIVLLVEAATK